MNCASQSFVLQPQLCLVVVVSLAKTTTDGIVENTYSAHHNVVIQQAGFEEPAAGQKHGLRDKRKSVQQLHC
jgi:hypothetical protein